MVYGRSVNQRVLDFVHSGKLWNDSLVLEDRQTGSLWAQVAGFAAGDDPDAVAVALPGGGGRQVARLRWGHREIVVEHQGSTGSTRAWLSSGPPDWARNEEIPASTMYWFVWAGLHPDSRIADGEWRQATFPPR